MPNESPIPSRRAFERAIEDNQRAGHENRGFLSLERGFLPSENPLLTLPETHRVWDDIADQLPAYFKNLTVRMVLDDMPVLPADAQHLPDRYLLRASTLISILTHAYVRSEATAHQQIPTCLLQPWEEIARRLGRPVPFLSYIDLILYNWRVRTSTLPNAIQLDNLDLLVPTVGNEEERIFYLTQVEIHAAFTPALHAVIRAQEAVQNDDPDALEHELRLMITTFFSISEHVLQHIDPNPHSKTYVDQVIWTKTVAPFAVSVVPNRPGPSGTASPVFHLMDAFLSRPRYDTVLGHEANKLADLSPRHWRDFIAAVRQISIRDYILSTNKARLKGTFDTLLEAYAGDKGYLGAHRLKAHGFLEIAFKAGRSVTIGGFKGLFREKTWKQIDSELGLTRHERYLGLPQHYDIVRPSSGQLIPQGDRNWIGMIQLKIQGQGIFYRAGDRCGILPENSDALIRKTLNALQAQGIEQVALNQQWQYAIQLRAGYAGERHRLSIEELLRFGKIRPLTREMARMLYRITRADALRQLLEAQLEDQLELWDALTLVGAAGFDTRRFWKADPWDEENLCHLIAPETYRPYSIASAMNADETLHLTITGLEYTSPGRLGSAIVPAKPRHGTASSFIRRLIEHPEANPEVSVRIVPAPRFHLPEDVTRPIVMVAAGSGIAPFLGFLQAREVQPEAGENWLFYGTQTTSELFRHPEIHSMVASGRLALRVAFSQEDSHLVFKDGAFLTEPGQRAYIDKRLNEEAEILWQLIRRIADGGHEAYFYICGRAHFANTVMEAFKKVIRRYTQDDDQAQQLFYRLVADRRYLLDVFTTYSGPASAVKQTFGASEVVLHNNESAGYWMVLSGKVYDLTEFVNLHPGGKRILANNMGIDATAAYRAVLHHARPEVDSLLGLYEIGAIRRLQFGNAWAVGIGPNGLFYFTLEEAFTTWVRALYLVTEMENAIRSDFDFFARATTRDELHGELTPLKIHLAVEAHKRFLSTFLAGFLDEEVHTLWAVTTGLFDKQVSIQAMRREIDRITSLRAATLVHESSEAVQNAIEALKISTGTARQTWFQVLGGWCQRIRVANVECFTNLKMAVREGVQCFEQYEGQTMIHGYEPLMVAMNYIITAIETYYIALSATLEPLLKQFGQPVGPTPQDHPQEMLTTLLGHGSRIDVGDITEDTFTHSEVRFLDEQ